MEIGEVYTPAGSFWQSPENGFQMPSPCRYIILCSVILSCRLINLYSEILSGQCAMHSNTFFFFFYFMDTVKMPKPSLSITSAHPGAEVIRVIKMFWKNSGLKEKRQEEGPSLFHSLSKKTKPKLLIPKENQTKENSWVMLSCQNQLMSCLAAFWAFPIKSSNTSDDLHPQT